MFNHPLRKNTLFPGRDNYIGPMLGWFGFLHHATLFEHSSYVHERVEYIRIYKPKHEIAIRLHNMIYWGDCDETIAKVNQLNEYDDERTLLNDAILAYIKSHIPDCAWNGETLVFPSEKI